jgi:hypothetical protein
VAQRKRHRDVVKKKTSLATAIREGAGTDAKK